MNFARYVICVIKGASCTSCFDFIRLEVKGQQTPHVAGVRGERSTLTNLVFISRVRGERST